MNGWYDFGSPNRKENNIMAIPELSPEARAEALEKAKAARIKRAQVREELKAGKLTVAQVLDMRDDHVVGRMKISTLIETLPGYGRAHHAGAPDRREPPHPRYRRASA